jgi:hypothetical protein
MSFWGLFKPKPKTEMKKLLEKIHTGIFPGGNKQMNAEVDEVSHLIGDKYSRDQMSKLYNHMAGLFYIAEDKSEERIVKSAMIKMDSKIAEEDIVKIYDYVKKIIETKIRHRGSSRVE